MTPQEAIQKTNQNGEIKVKEGLYLASQKRIKSIFEATLSRAELSQIDIGNIENFDYWLYGSGIFLGITGTEDNHLQQVLFSKTNDIPATVNWN